MLKRQSETASALIYKELVMEKEIQALLDTVDRLDSQYADDKDIEMAEYKSSINGHKLNK
jgi:hypothetical protein